MVVDSSFEIVKSIYDFPPKDFDLVLKGPPSNVQSSNEESLPSVYFLLQLLIRSLQVKLIPLSLVCLSIGRESLSIRAYTSNAGTYYSAWQILEWGELKPREIGCGCVGLELCRSYHAIPDRKGL